MTTEAKVGMFTIAALALLSFMAVHLGGWGFGGESGYKVQAVFNQVNGLKPGNLVRYAGVEVGRVHSVEPDGKGARVTLLLREGVKIPVGASFSIGSDGLMGEKFISISPGEETGESLQPDAVVLGVDQRGLDHLMVTADEVMIDVQKLIRSLNAVFGDERVKTAMIASAVNAQELTANLNQMSAVMARMAVTNEQDLRTMVSQLSVMSQNMASAAATVDRMLTDLDNGGQTAAQLRTAIGNLSSTSHRIENMATVLEGVVTDPQTADDLRATLHNARGVSERADKMMRQVSDISTEFSAEVLYSGGADRYVTNAEVRLHTSPYDFLLVGVDDIGEGDKANLQIGSGSDKFTGRIGVFDNKAGLGFDSYVNSALKLSVDAYDPNDPSVDLRVQYELAPRTFLIGQTSDINKSGERTSYVGLRQGF